MSLVKGVPVFFIMIAILVALLGPALAPAVQQLAAPRPAQRAAQPQAVEVAPVAAAALTAEEMEAAAYYADSSHAVAKHGGIAVEQVQNCLSAKGPAASMWNPLSTRHASVCELSGGRFGVEVDDDGGDFVTAFIAKKAKCLQEVVDYLAHYGYLMQ